MSSIITREAAHGYPRLAYPGFENPEWGDTGSKDTDTSNDMQEAYMAGAEREPTDVEVETVAEQLYYAECNASGLFFGLNWNALPEADKADHRSRARGFLAAAHAKATQEEETE